MTKIGVGQVRLREALKPVIIGSLKHKSLGSICSNLLIYWMQYGDYHLETITWTQ